LETFGGENACAQSNLVLLQVLNNLLDPIDIFGVLLIVGFVPSGGNLFGYNQRGTRSINREKYTYQTGEELLGWAHRLRDRVHPQ
jgi:hypothetical protein